MLLNTSAAYASETYIFAAEDSWPPFAKADGTGLSRSIIEQALGFSGITSEFIVVPYARALRMAENGEVDGVFNVTKQTSTVDKFAFGEIPLLQASASYYYPEDQAQSITRPKDIPDNTSIALIIGYEYGNEYEQERKRFREFRVSSQQQIVQMLMEKKVDMAILFDEVAVFTLASMNLPKHTLEKGQINHTSNIYVAFSRRATDLQQKINALDAGLRRLNGLPAAD